MLDQEIIESVYISLYKQEIIDVIFARGYNLRIVDDT